MKPEPASKKASSAKITPSKKGNANPGSVPEKSRAPKRRDPGEESAKPNAVPSAGTYPRRAFIISVHNYLYLNPLTDDTIRGAPDRPSVRWEFDNTLSLKLNIPRNQIFHLSDAHENVKERRPPLKTVIEKGLENFLKTTRKQDRIMVFFIGHTKEIESEAYLVPLEGETDDVKTLIPLKWVYDQLAKCEARQKILVLDGNRFNAAQGVERPLSGPMGPKFEAMLRAPPAGVQVWSACSANQQSHQFEESPLGLFLSSLRTSLSPAKGKGKGALEGKIPQRNDLIPLKELNDAVAKRMQDELERRKLFETEAQRSLISGHPPTSGSDYDRTELAAESPALPSVDPSSQGLVAKILDEISLPSLKGSQGGGRDVDFRQLPPFSPDALKAFEEDLKTDSKLRLAIHEARVALWSISQATTPAELKGDVDAYRSKLGVGIDLSMMRDSFIKPLPSGEAAFKARVTDDGRAMAKIVLRLEDILDRLKEAGKEKGEAPRRWQANYTYIYARVQAQLAYLEDYQSLLGSIKKEYPPHDPNIHSGWKMASKEKASDSIGKKYDRAAQALRRGCQGLQGNPVGGACQTREADGAGAGLGRVLSDPDRSPQARRASEGPNRPQARRASEGQRLPSLARRACGLRFRRSSECHFDFVSAPFARVAFADPAGDLHGDVRIEAVKRQRDGPTE